MKIACQYEFINICSRNWNPSLNELELNFLIGAGIGIELFNGDQNWNWNLKIGIDPSPGLLAPCVSSAYPLYPIILSHGYFISDIFVCRMHCWLGDTRVVFVVGLRKQE